MMVPFLALSASSPSPAAASRVRVMTFNTWNYNDPWEIRRRLIAACITEAAPDVVGLQEIRLDAARSPLDQAQQIVELLGDEYEAVYRPAMVYERDPICAEGLAILTRWPAARSHAVELTRDPNDQADRHQRIVLHAEIATPAGPLHFLNTHWSLSEPARLRNAAEVRALVARTAGVAPVILAGDLNSTPDGAGAQALFEPDSAGGAVLRDGWPAMHPDQPGFTYRCDKPARRIDYIAYHLGDGCAGRLLGIRLACCRPTDGVFPSDHVGVVADFELSAPQGRQGARRRV
jgi:endonuclease/exonuclease/phosphatase family metal-dependent hydrolase